MWWKKGYQKSTIFCNEYNVASKSFIFYSKKNIDKKKIIFCSENKLINKSVIFCSKIIFIGKKYDICDKTYVTGIKCTFCNRSLHLKKLIFLWQHFLTEKSWCQDNGWCKVFLQRYFMAKLIYYHKKLAFHDVPIIGKYWFFVINFLSPQKILSLFFFCSIAHSLVLLLDAIIVAIYWGWKGLWVLNCGCIEKLRAIYIGRFRGGYLSSNRENESRVLKAYSIVT